VTFREFLVVIDRHTSFWSR